VLKTIGHPDAETSDDALAAMLAKAWTA